MVEVVQSTRLAGKTCFVTGAAQGIGQSIAERLSAEGARVIRADRSFVDGDGQCHLDVTDDDAVIAAAHRHGDVDVLVNCVGYVATGTILDMSNDDFERSISLNVRSMASTIRAFLPAMLDRRSGSIINIASVVSTVAAAPARCAYATSKGAVIALTMAVARDFIAQGVRCNAISPGTVDTPSLQERFAATGDVAAAREAFVARQPMGRLGQANEIAAVAALLASDESGFMSGSNIVIDGGMSL